jgi:hypothetical protein
MKNHVIDGHEAVVEKPASKFCELGCIDIGQ